MQTELSASTNHDVKGLSIYGGRSSEPLIKAGAIGRLTEKATKQKERSIQVGDAAGAVFRDSSTV